MISTINGEIGADVSVTDIFSATFSMGSMTESPKRVMELIDEYEKTKRVSFPARWDIYLRREYGF